MQAYSEQESRAAPSSTPAITRQFFFPSPLLDACGRYSSAAYRVTDTAHVLPVLREQEVRWGDTCSIFRGP